MQPTDRSSKTKQPPSLKKASTVRNEDGSSSARKAIAKQLNNTGTSGSKVGETQTDQDINEILSEHPHQMRKLGNANYSPKPFKDIKEAKPVAKLQINRENLMKLNRDQSPYL